MVKIPVVDNKDFCLVCGKEIPPGPDFCSSECEQEAEDVIDKAKEKIIEPST